MTNNTFPPICMAEDYWADSQFSVAKYYGGCIINKMRFRIVNKAGITVYELSDPDCHHYVGDGEEIAIKEGEPADLLREDFIPFYKKLGRDKFLAVLQEHPNATDIELKKTYKQLIKK